MENYQIQQEINIDFSTPDVPPRVYAKQYDNNMRIIKANLYACLLYTSDAADE